MTLKYKKYTLGVLTSTLLSLFLASTLVFAAVTISQNLQIGGGTPDLTLDGDDAYINGTLEVNGVARFDGNLELTAQSSLTGLATSGTLQHFGNNLFFTSNNYRYNLTKRTATTTAIESVKTWTARAATEANSWSGVTWSPELGLFAAVSFTGTNRVMTSPDGITWTARSAAEANS